MPVADVDGDSENDDEEPMNRHARLHRESQSVEHQILHIPKNPYCEICQRIRMYKRRTQSKRYDQLGSRGDLPEVASFGERIACDFIIVSKARTEGRHNVVLVVRDEYSGLIGAFPCGSKSSETINKHLLAFLGPSYHVVPSVMMKSDQAGEFIASCAQLGFQHEPTLENRWPHNSQLEREIRTIEKVTRALHLQAGFCWFQDLWPLTMSHAAWMITCYHAKPGVEDSRYKLAIGEDLMLGQLVYVRDFERKKFDANDKPPIFAGYNRLDTGSTYKGVYLVLDYQALKEQTAGYQIASSVPCEEVFVPEGSHAPVQRFADSTS